MLRPLITILMLALLAGCAGSTGGAGSTDLHRQALANCTAYGFGPDSDGHAHCLMTETQSLRAERVARNDALFRSALDTRDAPRLDDPLDQPAPGVRP